MADNAIGYTHASGVAGVHAFTSKVVDSLFVGETENIGNPEDRSGDRLTVAPCRSQRSRITRSVATSTTISVMTCDNTTFVNFEDNATRKAGALSYLLFTSFGVSTNNTVERAEIR